MREAQLPRLSLPNQVVHVFRAQQYNGTRITRAGILLESLLHFIWYTDNEFLLLKYNTKINHYHIKIRPKKVK